MFRCCFYLVIALALTGCVYPVYKTLQPDTRITVVDSASHPVPDAAVSLITYTRPAGLEKSDERILTGRDGVAVFPSRKEWRTEVTMIHGSEEFSWLVCVRKEGFAPYLSGAIRDEAHLKSLDVTLRPGLDQPCAKTGSSFSGTPDLW